MKPEDKLRDIYHLSPVLWAVIQGHRTRLEIEDALNKDCSRAIRGAIASGMLLDDAGRLRPTLGHHIKLIRLLNPDNPEINKAPHTIIDLLTLHGSLSTVDVATRTKRPYNSAYKTLRRLQDQGLVTRRGNLWVRV